MNRDRYNQLVQDRMNMFDVVEQTSWAPKVFFAEMAPSVRSSDPQTDCSIFIQKRTGGYTLTAEILCCKTEITRIQKKFKSLLKIIQKHRHASIKSQSRESAWSRQKSNQKRWKKKNGFAIISHYLDKNRNDGKCLFERKW